MAMTPTTINAAAPIATRAEMLRIILLWPEAGGNSLEESEVEFGLRTMGLGRTVGQELFTWAPHRAGFPATDDGDIVLKNPPEGSSPCKWLYEMLNDEM